MNFEIHPQLSHLSNEQISQLIRRYYEGDKVKDLIKEFSIDIKISKSGKLVSFFPRKVLEEKCPYCDIHLQEKRPSKSAITSNDFKREHLPTCPSCGHIAAELFSYPITKTGWNSKKALAPCACRHCTETKLDNAQACIEEFNAHRDGQITFQELELKDLIQLAAFCSDAELSNGEYSLSRHKHLSPGGNSDDQMLKELLKKGILKISKQTGLQAFSFDEKHDVININLLKCSHVPNVKYKHLDTLKEEALEEVTRRFDSSIVFDLYRHFWAEAELMAFYSLNHLQWVHDSQRIPKKATEAITFLIENFGLGEGIYLISHSFPWCQKKLKEGAFSTRAHAVNSVPYNIIYLGEWLISNGEETTTSALPAETDNCLRSVFCALLKLPESNISQRITKESLDYFKAVGELGNPICNAVGIHKGPTPSSAQPSLGHGGLFQIMEHMRWSIEMVSEFTGLDEERLFQILNNNSQITGQEKELFNALEALAKAKERSRA